MGTNITFTEQAFEEYLSWQGQDRKTPKSINAEAIMTIEREAALPAASLFVRGATPN